MSATSKVARRSPEVALLGHDAQHVAARIVARARAAHQFGATAAAYRDSAKELDREAARAERLLFGQTVRTFRAAAAESRLVADALDMIETG